MIGIQSTANQRQSNGLSSRVPYAVGKSISTCSRTAIIEIATSMPNDAFGADAGAAPRFAARRSRSAPADPDEPRAHDAESDDAERSVRRSAVPLQVGRGAARGSDDVDVRGVRGDDERGGRPAAGAAERCPRERQREQRVRDVIHAVTIPAC